tara:strand:- start:1576 stop:2745 length:1170 start_codon:yes stop_codon:yes gene_type:complete
MVSIENSITLDLNQLLYDKNLYTKTDFNYKSRQYKIIKYNKENYNKLSNEEQLKYSWLRSIIFDNDDNLLVLAPAKSVNYDYFKQYNSVDECYAEDFIDGTMINLYYDNNLQSWEICTRSNVGANNTFNNNKTFKEMFYDICYSIDFNLSMLNSYKNLTFSFVIQHPSNRIVAPISNNSLYLIKIMNIENIGNNSYNINFYNVHNFLQTSNIKSLCYCNIYNIDTYEKIYDYYKHINCPYYILGINIYNKNGTRTKIRNTNYVNIKILKGNQPKLQYNYLCLKKEKKINEYLLYFPEHSLEFQNYKSEIYDYTDNLYNNYIECFIKKTNVLKKYPREYRIHMWNLHNLYKDTLKFENKYIDKKIVINYVNSLQPAQQMYVINYSKYNIT